MCYNHVMEVQPRILILTDAKAGHENQSKAFVRALGCAADCVEVHFTSPRAKALSYVFDHLGIHSPRLFACTGGLPARGTYAAVVGTGSGTFYAVKTLARRWGVPAGVVLYPRGYRLATFDCILAPAFDHPAARPNVVAIPANLVAADAAFYAAGVARFKEHYRVTTGRAYTGARAVAVIVGGPNACATLTADWMRAQLDRIFAAAGPDGPEFWVTTSRRTPADVEAVIADYPWHYTLLYSRDHFNPIPAFVSCAETLYVTAESTGMLSEACTSGTADVRVLDNLKPGPHKFRRFVQQLRAGGYVDGRRKIDLAPQFAAARRLLRLV